MSDSDLYLVTHTSPDFDAIASVWLLKRYGGLADCPVRFVSAAADPETYADAVAVCDVGRVYDPNSSRFDHHISGHDDDSATLQAWSYLLSIERDNGVPKSQVYHLVDLVTLIHDADQGRAHESNTTGIHALLTAQKMTGASDDALLDWGVTILDALAVVLKARWEARLLLEKHTVYRSVDGLIVALHDAAPQVSRAAFEGGAALVIFGGGSQTLPDGSVTYPRGCQRNAKLSGPHVGELVTAIANGDDDVADEVRAWFNHPAGFFAGVGTAKAPCFEPMNGLVSDIAAAIDSVWMR